MAVKVDLENKLVAPDRIAEMALDDPELLQELVNGVAPQSQKSTRRENCSQSLMFMAETWPEALLPYWDTFFNLLKSDNGSSKYVAVYVIASLTKAEKTGKFEKYFDDYFATLDDASVMVASHAALNTAKIGKSYPELQPMIIHQLLQINNTHHTSNHLALVKAYIIESLDSLYETASNQPEILDFITAQLQSKSPKTVKQAKAFFKKWGK
jgi:hypothetical protein